MHVFTLFDSIIMDGWMDGQTDRDTNEWMDGWTDRQTTGWMDGRTNGQRLLKSCLSPTENANVCDERKRKMKLNHETSESAERQRHSMVVVFK